MKKYFILKSFLALFCSFMISFKVNAVGQYKTVEYNDGTKVFYVSTEKIEETLNLIDDIISARDFAQSSWILGALLSVPSLLSSELLSKLFPKLKNWKLVIGLSGPAMLAVLPRVINYFREEANKFADLAVHGLRDYIDLKKRPRKSSDYLFEESYLRDQKFVNGIDEGNGMAFVLFPKDFTGYWFLAKNSDLTARDCEYRYAFPQSMMSERYEKDLEQCCGGIKKVYDGIHFN